MQHSATRYMPQIFSARLVAALRHGRVRPAGPSRTHGAGVAPLAALRRPAVLALDALLRLPGVTAADGVPGHHGDCLGADLVDVLIGAGVAARRRLVCLGAGGDRGGDDEGRGEGETDGSHDRSSNWKGLTSDSDGRSADCHWLLDPSKNV